MNSHQNIKKRWMSPIFFGDTKCDLPPFTAILWSMFTGQTKTAPVLPEAFTILNFASFRMALSTFTATVKPAAGLPVHQ